MMKILRRNFLRIVVSVLGVGLLAFALFNVSELGTVAGPKGETGTLEKMIVANGSLSMDIDLEKLLGKGVSQRSTRIDYVTKQDTFFNVIVFNNEFRGPIPSAMELEPVGSTALPSRLADSYRNFVLERAPFEGSEYELIIRDGTTGEHYFNVEGHEYDFDPAAKTLGIRGGRILVANEFANELGRSQVAGTVVGALNVNVRLSTTEVAEVVNGETESNKLPPSGELAGTRPGPDVVVGDVYGLAQFGSAVGDYVGLAVGTNSCNYGTVDLNWFANPNNDHPVIPQNMYRVSGGTDNTERIEQIGQSSVKHAFTALTQNLCQLGCNGVGGSRLGSGCSDPYSASLNSGPNLGSKAWINPFTGFYPRNDSATPNNNHSGHSHVGTTHRVLTPIADLSTAQNPGATYYAEGQYVTPHEYAWCQSNPTQCNMFNNVSYRRYTVSGTNSPFSFSPAEATVREKAAIVAWPDASNNSFIPAPGEDGMAIIAYKVTEPSAGVYRYVYAIFNQNLDRGIGSFALPIGNNVSISNIDFHAPPQHPGSSADGTFNNAGFSNEPWTSSHTGGVFKWETETLAANPNANAIRWGTMYTFSFDSNRPPVEVPATIGFFKTGEPITTTVQAPSSPAAAAVSVAGRVTDQSGRGVYSTRVSITDSQGNTRYAITNPFGYYRFDGVIPGSMHTVAAASKRFNFAPQSVMITDNINNLDFVAK